MDAHYIFKFIIVGDMGVGKTCLLFVYTSGSFEEGMDSTIGVEFGTSTVEHGKYKLRLQIFDTAGQDAYLSVTKKYFRNTCGCLLVYDVSNRESFDHLRMWYDRVLEVAPDTVVCSVVANKVDRKDRRVSRTDGQRFAQSIGCPYVEASAKTNQSVKKIFESVAIEAMRRIHEGEIFPSPFMEHGVKRGELPLPKDHGKSSPQKDSIHVISLEDSPTIETESKRRKSKCCKS